VTWCAPPLHVIAVISNSQWYHTRFRLYREFERRMRQQGVPLHTVELALRDRPHMVTEPDNPLHLQLRSPSELWHKENLINLGARYLLPSDWEYMAWVDADVQFAHPNWATETTHLLQRFAVIQMCSRISDLDPVYQSFQTHKSFGWSYWHEPQYMGDEYVGKRGAWHPGFAWAIRRDAWEQLGGLYDRAILGSADRYMAHSFINDASPFIEGHGFHPSLVRSVLAYQDHAYSVVRGSVGYLSGVLLHYWHGAKKNRKYTERWDILKAHQFDPYLDVVYDDRGVLRWAGNKPALEHDVSLYFAQRNEDSIDFEARK
jgi:hypothetical protein